MLLLYMKNHVSFFLRPECNDLDLYKKMVAFVMAYSFTEPVGQDDDDDVRFYISDSIL